LPATRRSAASITSGEQLAWHGMAWHSRTHHDMVWHYKARMAWQVFKTDVCSISHHPLVRKRTQSRAWPAMQRSAAITCVVKYSLLLLLWVGPQATSPIAPHPQPLCGAMEPSSDPPPPPLSAAAATAVTDDGLC
jgi:hypothetical protein